MGGGVGSEVWTLEKLSTDVLFALWQCCWWYADFVGFERQSMFLFQLHCV